LDSGSVPAEHLTVAWGMEEDVAEARPILLWFAC